MQFSAHTQIPFTSKLHNLKGKSMCRSLVVLHQCIRIMPSVHLIFSCDCISQWSFESPAAVRARFSVSVLDLFLHFYRYCEAGYEAGAAYSLLGA